MADSPHSLEELTRRLDAAKEDAGLTEKPEQSRGRQLSLGFRLSIELVAGALVGLGIGYALDRWLGLTPWLMIVFFFLGTTAGVMNVKRTVELLDKPDASAKTPRA